MKNFIFTALFALVTLTAFGQAKPLLSDQPKATAAQRLGDTLSASQTESQTIKITGLYDQVVLQANVYKISGTHTGSKIFVKGSVDGTVFVKLDSLVLLNTAAGAPGVQALLYRASPAPFVAYRFEAATTGTTQSLRFNSYWLVRNKN